MQNLNHSPFEIDTSNDNIIIVKNLETVIGGRSLDATNYSNPVIYAGHPIYKDDDGTYKPLEVVDEDLTTTNAAKTVGVVVATVLTEEPSVAIMVRGTVNEEAFKNSTGYSYPATVKSNLSLIRFTQD